MPLLTSLLPPTTSSEVLPQSINLDFFFLLFPFVFKRIIYSLQAGNTFIFLHAFVSFCHVRGQVDLFIFFFFLLTLIIMKTTTMTTMMMMGSGKVIHFPHSVTRPFFCWFGARKTAGPRDEWVGKASFLFFIFCFATLTLLVVLIVLKLNKSQKVNT